MNKIAIIIPSRLKAKRLENKPLKLINNKEMILHVYEAAIKSNSGEVYVATPDKEIITRVKKFGGNVIQTSYNHQTGTDRVFEVFENVLKGEPDLIINLQGDMPNIQPEAINNLVNYMKKQECDIGTLASQINSLSEIENPNIVKVTVDGNLSKNIFLKAVDFFRINSNSKLNIYHHVGIYAFTNEGLKRYVKFKRSKLELNRNLEQLRALENNMSIHVGYIESCPLSVDTEEDLIEIRKIMKK